MKVQAYIHSLKDHVNNRHVLGEAEIIIAIWLRSTASGVRQSSTSSPGPITLMMCTASSRRTPENCPVRVRSNGTAKKRPIRVGFRVLVRSRLETDSNGTFCANLFFERGN